MPILAKDNNGGGGDFTPAPAGLHNAVCVDVIDLGMQTMPATPQYPASTKHKVRVVWEIDEEMPEGRRFAVGKPYTLSLNEKATLRHDLESWRSRPFNAEELNGFDVEKLVGAPAMVQVIHKPGTKGGTFANVVAVTPLPRGMPKLARRDYTRSKRDVEMSEAAAQQPAARAPEEFQATDDEVPF